MTVRLIGIFFESIVFSVTKVEIALTSADLRMFCYLCYVNRYMPNYMNLRYIPMYAAGAFPLDMSQFGQLFNSTRIPCLKKDKLESYSNSRFVEY